MPTQEERLTALEQAQAKFGEAINDLNHHVTILIGVASREEWDIRELKSSFRAIDGRMGSLEGRMGSLEGHLGSLEGRILPNRNKKWRTQLTSQTSCLTRVT